MAASTGSNQAIKPDSNLFKSFVGVAAIKKGYEGVDRDKVSHEESTTVQSMRVNH